MTSWLELDGTSSGYAWCPDTPSLYGADFDIRILCAATSWASGLTQTIVAQWEGQGNQRAYRLDFSTSGSMRMGIASDGITESANSAGAAGTAPALVDGEPMWTRWVRVSSTGAFVKQRSLDGINWTDIATGTLAAGSVLFNSTAVHIIGGRDAIPPGGASTPFTGRVYYVEIRFAVDGPIVASANFRIQTPGTTSFIDAQGNLWTLNGTASIQSDGVAIAPTLRCLDSDDLLDLLLPSRQSTFRFDLIDASTFEVIGELHPMLDQPVVVANDVTRAIKRQLGPVMLTPSEAGDIDPFTDRIRPVMVLENGAEYPLGEFMAADESMPERSFGAYKQLMLVDQSLVLDPAVDHAVSVPFLGDLLSAFYVLILETGLTRYALEATGARTTSPMTWSVGTSRLQILTEIAGNGGWFSPYFDSDGVLRLRRQVDPSTDVPVVSYRIGQNIYDESVVRSNNLLSAPNRFLVVDNGMTEIPVVGSFDVPPSAPHSIFNRGFAVVDTYFSQGVGTVAQAQEVAQTRAQEYPLTETVSFTGPPDPRHDTFSVIEFDGEAYLEVAWTLVLLEGAPMQHTLVRRYV